MMVCYDEFSPGDMLNYDNSRKTMVLAFNFEQLGTAVLEKDYSWMVPIAVRSVKIKKVLGDIPDEELFQILCGRVCPPVVWDSSWMSTPGLLRAGVGHKAWWPIC